LNARDAVAATGRADARVRLATWHDDVSVSILVADDGDGIHGDLSRVFDPYFTTKRAGTGLGLPIAKNIVEGLGDRLWSPANRAGAPEFVIQLPATSRLRARPRASVPISDAKPRLDSPG